MFSQIKLVRKAIESLYTGICTVTEQRKVQKANKSTGFENVVVLEDEPCRVSYKTISGASSSDSATSVSQVTVLFLSPLVKIKPGSKVRVTQNEVTIDYESSGQPAIYPSHQEVILEFKGWA